MAGIAADLIEEEGDGVGVGRLGKTVVLGVAALGEVGLGRRGNASGNGDFRAASFGEEAVEELSASFGVAEGGGDAEDLEFGAAEGEGDGEGVVNVVADVGVQDYFLEEGVSRRGLG